MPSTKFAQVARFGVAFAAGVMACGTSGASGAPEPDREALIAQVLASSEVSFALAWGRSPSPEDRSRSEHNLGCILDGLAAGHLDPKSDLSCLVHQLDALSACMRADPKGANPAACVTARLDCQFSDTYLQVARSCRGPNDHPAIAP